MWRLLIFTALWVGYVVALNRPWQVGELALPAIGQFFSPGSGFWRNAEPVRGMPVSEELHLDGLQGPVRIVLDERLVPHVFAEHDADVWFAQGYITAKFRLWQMDISTRATAGELSNIFGERLLGFDKLQREQGMGLAAENAVKGWENFPDGMTAITSYAAGYNCYLKDLPPAEYPVEFKLMDYAPEPWSPLKSALFVKSMATRLCMAEDDLEHTMLMKWLGKERFDHLFTAHDPLESPVIPAGTPWNFDVVSVKGGNQDLPETIGQHPSETSEDPIEGSNNWAVSGARTESGRPILCNDPHLGLSLPSVWFEIQLATPNFNVYGVSLPGMPGVIIGFNEHIAWGITNTGYDVLDWYSIKWTDDAQATYSLDSVPTPVSYRIEEIMIKGQKAVLDTVKYTIWGPVQKSGPHAGLAMRWLAHDIPDSHEASVFLRLNKAKSHDEFKAALAGFQTPAQNIVYADKEGNIALQVTGKMPLRRDRAGKFVQDGSMSLSGWDGRIPAGHNPSVLNPPRGFVSSANQESTDTTYPYVYLGLFEDFRGRILNRYLASIPRSSLTSMQRLQNSNVSLKAEELLPHLLNAMPALKGEQADLLKRMGQWQYDYATEASAPVFFELWYETFCNGLWDDFIQYRDSVYIRLPHAWRTNQLVMQEPGSPEFDLDSTAYKETFADIAQLSFQQAVDRFEAIDKRDRTWGAFRKTAIRHMANIPAFSEEISVGGHGDALNATTTSHGPSWRMVVHLTDPIQASVVYPGGQSGNPGSPHYADMITTWQEGAYYDARFLKTPEDLADGRLIQMNPGRK